jgi:glutamyl-tRNA synthetase
MKNSETRVRFAPSPTGPLHIGGVRTALYNYLFARHHGGKIVLRIEDTDQSRYVPGAENYIIKSLDWCGIRFDEGVHLGGPFQPYKQSERQHIYRKYVNELMASGHAYYAFDTPEELEIRRKEAEKEGGVFTYDASVRGQMRNSLVLSEDETEEILSSGVPYVVRFKIPENEELVFHDLIRGKIAVETDTLDDKVLFKSDGMPTYHLANIVDDHLMRITHVIRGEEWLPSLPLHVLLYRALHWEAPAFAHLPLILKPEGTGKLSKRDGDRLGFPVFPIEWSDPKTGEVFSGYRESGYYPEAVINMLALLGWNPGTEQEIFSMDKLISEFTLERVGKSGSRFDPDKARWFNHQYLVKRNDSELAQQFQEILKEKGIIAENSLVIRIIGMVKERINFLSEAWEQSYFFFKRPESYDQKTIRKKWKEDTPLLLKGIITLFNDMNDFLAENIKSVAEAYATNKSVGVGQIILPVRICLVGGPFGPDLFTICELLGKEEVIARIETAIDTVSNIKA